MSGISTGYKILLYFLFGLIRFELYYSFKLTSFSLLPKKTNLDVWHYLTNNKMKMSKNDLTKSTFSSTSFSDLSINQFDALYQDSLPDNSKISLKILIWSCNFKKKLNHPSSYDRHQKLSSRAALWSVDIVVPIPPLIWYRIYICRNSYHWLRKVLNFKTMVSKLYLRYFLILLSVFARWTQSALTCSKPMMEVPEYCLELVKS